MIHPTTRLNRSFYPSLLIVILILPVGCSPHGFLNPVAKFQKASSVVISSTRLYISELNKSERDHYIQQRLGEKAQIKINDIEAAQVFSKDGLKARLDALNQLESYGDLLLKLANSDSPEKVQASAKDLGDEITKLSTTVNSLNGDGNSDFKSAVGPVSSIVGEILNLVAQKKMKDALNKAISTGREPVNNLITAIRNDINLAYERKKNALSGLRVDLVDAYNEEMSKGGSSDSEKLKLLAERVIAHEDRWETFASSNPGEGLNAMVSAHNALVNYAGSSQKIEDLSTLIEALEAFTARAESLGKSIKSLQEI